jgi:hypothetical protein
VEYLVGAVVRTAFDYGEGAIGRPKEDNRFNDRAEEAGEERSAAVEVECEEIFWL